MRSCNRAIVNFSKLLPIFSSMKGIVKTLYSVAVAAIVSAAVSCSSDKERDVYLKSLDLEIETLSYVDSLNIDQYDLFQANSVVKTKDDRLILSTTEGGYKLLIINLANPEEYFFGIRRGRGPGEMVQGGSLHKRGEDAYLYDLDNAICIRIDCSETIRQKTIVADTVGIFTQGTSKPVYMTTCGDDGFISGNMSDLSMWYSYYDAHGNILSGIPKFECDGFEGDRLLSLLLSSKYVSNPAGTKVCVVSVAEPILSFSDVHSGILTEYRRYDLSGSGDGTPYYGPDAISAFHGIAADNRNVYVIYSGHKLQNDVLPVNECNHLIVYDWDGTPIRHFKLNRNVSSIHIDGDDLWCTSTYPESCVYRFKLPPLK